MFLCGKPTCLRGLDGMAAHPCQLTWFPVAAFTTGHHALAWNDPSLLSYSSRDENFQNCGVCRALLFPRAPGTICFLAFSSFRGCSPSQAHGAHPFSQSRALLTGSSSWTWTLLPSHKDLSDYTALTQRTHGSLPIRRLFQLM